MIDRKFKVGSQKEDDYETVPRSATEEIDFNNLTKSTEEKMDQLEFELELEVQTDKEDNVSRGSTVNGDDGRTTALPDDDDMGNGEEETEDIAADTMCQLANL